MSQRRTFLKTAGAVGIAGLFAGCTGNTDNNNDGGGGDTDDGTPTATKTPVPYGNGEVNFVMSPSEPQDLMEKQYQPIKEYLNEQTGLPTTLKYARNYSAVLQAMGSGTADIAETGPFAAALGVKADKADIALQRYAYGSWEYTSVIVTKESSDINSLSDLKGKTVGFADRLSASGALFPLYMLKQAGLKVGGYPQEQGSANFEATFSGHAQAFEQLANDQVAAAGVGQFITLNDDRNLKDGYEYVKTYDGIPRAPIVTSPELSDEEQNELVNALKDAPDSMYLGADGEEGTDDDLWFSDVRPADVEKYQPVIDVANELGIETEYLDS
ncbi:phosphate/phosphite/phosphonate ABC transporter substrate-binding protein [Halorarius halobius]|uniref:phosphate/phosphite/phosphonate ABC transporter substrate-binding protein n=1 Tax=Halorarius halobius TaxID=2962671 RepID=UPI0020CE7953|nr:phosphate/phosphite/phosphonate ABC transporter substrate-binding protein [Halorarius halobius]